VAPLPADRSPATWRSPGSWTRRPGGRQVVAEGTPQFWWRRHL